MKNNRITSNTRPFIPGLFTFSIVCYRNWEFLTETIDSVLMQDYNSIQLIVSDDGTGNFPIQEFETYIETHKRDNIVSYIVRESEKNEGTVRHLNHVLECVEGEYFMIMAADDTLDNSSVFSRYVKALEREGEDCGVVMAQTAMYDVTMTNVLEYFVWPDVIDAINSSGETDALLQQLYYMPCIPTTSTCFRRWVIDEYTPFNTNYFLIEDYPFHLKLAEAGVKMRYENFVSARHRDGGISHGAVTALSETKRRYYMDCINSRKAVLKSIRKHGSTREITSINKFIISNTDSVIIRTGSGKKGVLRYAMKYPMEFILELSQRFGVEFKIKWYIYLMISVICCVCIPDIVDVIGQLASIIPSEVIRCCLMLAGAGALFVSVLAVLANIVFLIVNRLTAFPEDIL